MVVRALTALIAAALAMAVASTSAAAGELTLIYELYRNEQPLAEVVDVLSYDDARYTIVSEAKGKGALALLPLGMFRRESSGSITTEGLRPDRFREQRGGRVALATFDWNARQLAMDYRGNVETREIVGALQDRLALAYNFLFAPLPADSVFIRVTDGRGISEASYRVAATEVIATAAGRFKVVRLEKLRTPEDERETTLWFAETQPRLPVRALVVEKDGTRLDQVLVRISP